jgi:hypothetical protein
MNRPYAPRGRTIRVWTALYSKRYQIVEKL